MPVQVVRISWKYMSIDLATKPCQTLEHKEHHDMCFSSIRVFSKYTTIWHARRFVILSWILFYGREWFVSLCEVVVEVAFYVDGEVVRDQAM